MGNAHSYVTDPAVQSERSRTLDTLGGWGRKPIRRGDSLGAKMDMLSLAVKDTQEGIGQVVDSGGSKARIDMQEATIAQLKKLVVQTKHTHHKEPDHPDIRATELRLEHEEKVLKELKASAQDAETIRVSRQRSMELPDSADLPSPDYPPKNTKPVQRKWVNHTAAAPEPKPRNGSSVRGSVTNTPRSTATGARASTGSPALGAIPRSMRASMTSAGSFTRSPSTRGSTPVSYARRASISGPISDSKSVAGRSTATAASDRNALKIVTQYDPEFYGFPSDTPEWRTNIARAKRTFHLAFRGARAFQYRLVLKQRPIPKLSRVPSFSVHVPMVLGGDLKRFATEQMALLSKHEKAFGPITPVQTDSARPSQTGTRRLSNPGPRPSRGPGTLSKTNSGRVSSSGAGSVAGSLESLMPTADELEEMKAFGEDIVMVSSFQVPKDAMKNLQMMKVYCNRGNTRWTEDREWICGKSFDLDTFQRMGGLDYSHFKLSAEELLKDGHVAYQIFDSDVMRGLRDGEQLPIWLQDPWEMVEEHLGENRLPLGDHFQNLTYASRLLISLHIALEGIVGLNAVRKMTVMLHLPSEYADEIVDRIVTDRWYGFMPENVVFIPQASFGGYCYDKKTNLFKQVEGSMMDSPGSGESMRQLMFYQEAFTVNTDRKKIWIQTSLVDHLKVKEVKWLRSMFIDDIIAAHSDNIVDVTALAMTLKSNTTLGTNCVIQAADVPDPQIALKNGNLVLSSVPKSDPSSKDGVTPGDAHYQVQQVNADDVESLKWKTRLQELKAEADKSPGSHMLTSTGRCFTNLHALESMLPDRNLFHVSLALQGPYVYPKLHMCDITTSPKARTVAFTTKLPCSHSFLNGVPFSEDLLPKLTQQDKWPLFKRQVGKYASQTANIVTQTSSAYKRAPRTFVLIVTDNEVSRDAYDFFVGAFSTTMSADDVLIIMSTVKSPDEEQDRLELLKTFTDPMMSMHTVKHEVVVRHNKGLVTVLEDYCDEKQPYMAILGTDGLSDTGKAGGILLGSVSMNLAKQLSWPLLVVKPSRACQLLRNTDGVSEPINIMFMADPSAQMTFEYMTTVLDNKRGDTFFFARPWGLDNSGAETMAAKSTLTYYCDLASDLAFESQRRALEGAAATHLPHVTEHEHGHIVALHMGKAKVLDEKVRDLLLKCNCAVLLNKVNKS